MRVKKQKIKRSKLFRLAILGFAVYIIVTMIQLQVDIKARQDELAAIEAQCQQQELNNDELERLLASGDDMQYIERIARETLGYVMPDERVFIDMSGS